MKISHMSASSIKTYNMCNFSYYLRYICKLKGFQNPGALKGTIFHAVMEDMANLIIQDKNYTKADCGASLAKHWNEETEKEKQWCKLTEDDKDYLKKELDKALFSDKIIDCNIIGIEKDFDFTFDYAFNLLSDDLGNKAEEIGSDIDDCIAAMGECFRFVGFMDLVYEKDKDTIVIRDYKTSKITKSKKECASDIQFLMYDLAAKLLYPQYKNREIEVIFLNGKDVNFQYKDDEYKKTIRYLKNKWIEIKENERPVQTISNKDRFWKCDFCSFRGEKNEKGKYKGGKWQCNRLINIMGHDNTNLELIFEKIRNGEKI